LADKQEYSRSITAVLKQHILAESAKIGHKVAKSTKSANEFDWPVGRSKHDTSSEDAWLNVLRQEGLPLCLKDEEAANIWLNLVTKIERGGMSDEL